MARHVLPRRGRGLGGARVLGLGSLIALCLAASALSAAQTGELVVRGQAAVSGCPAGCEGYLPGVVVAAAALFRSSSGHVALGFQLERAWFRYDPAPDFVHPTGDARPDLHARTTVIGGVMRWHPEARRWADPWFQAGVGFGWVGSAFLDGRADHARAGESALSIAFDASAGIEIAVGRGARLGVEVGMTRFGVRRECAESAAPDPTGACTPSFGFGEGYVRAGLVWTWAFSL